VSPDSSAQQMAPPTPPPPDEAVARLAERVQALEDELAITRLLTSYGFAVDGDDADGCAEIYAPDAIVRIDDTVTLTGRDELRTIVTCDAHQAILPGCAHVMGPFTVAVSADTATATGYATVFVAQEGSRQVWRQSLSRWELARIDGQWRVVSRASWAIGRAEGQAIARAALQAVPGGRAEAGGA
jgi:ketosteroid isomerase-like protein